MKKGYLGLEGVVAIVLAIIPVTSWILGAITRILEGNLVAGILRLVLWCTGIGSLILWIADIYFMVTTGSVWHLLK